MQIEYTTEKVFGTDDGRVNLSAREPKRNIMHKRKINDTRCCSTLFQLKVYVWSVARSKLLCNLPFGFRLQCLTSEPPSLKMTREVELVNI